MLRKATLPLLLCTLGLLLSAGPVAAQASRGDSEVLLFGFVAMNPDAAADSAFGTFNFNYGVFVTNGLELGGGPSVSISTADTTMGVNFFVRQYFGRARVAPYVGGEFFNFNVEDDAASYLGFSGGVKSYVSERAALDFRGQYGFQAVTPAPGFSRAKSLQFSVGLTVLF